VPDRASSIAWRRRSTDAPIAPAFWLRSDGQREAGSGGRASEVARVKLGSGEDSRVASRAVLREGPADVATGRALASVQRAQSGDDAVCVAGETDDAREQLPACVAEHAAWVNRLPDRTFRRFRALYAREMQELVAQVDQVTAWRIAENQATFRDANERIEQAAEKHKVPRPPFLCECADPECTETIFMDLAEYESVRSRSVDFLVVPGHERASGPHGRVVRDAGTYRVVEKVGEAGDVARERDDRAA
jgi:hypothetical protein